jgi:uncharacterized protein
MNLIIAFITGLTAGGLGCLAVQSGLLATALTHQLELEMRSFEDRGLHDERQNIPKQFARPLFLFLFSKLSAYTILGFLLGAFGAILQPTPRLHATVMIAIGIFMLGNGLRMFKVHPIFRYFVFEPPSCFKRFIRHSSKNSTSPITPLFLGAITVLLPCGVAQSMMAAAMGTGDPYQGAVILFAFTLGTIPVFVAVTFFAASLGSILKKNLTRIAALILIVLGLIPIDYGLNLAGSPVSFTKVLNRLAATSNSPVITSPHNTNVSSQENYKVTVDKHGYTPNILHLPANKPIRLIWQTYNTKSCALIVVVPKLDYEQTLPSTGQVPLVIPAQKKGTVIEYSCSMGMYRGQLIFDQN